MEGQNKNAPAPPSQGQSRVEVVSKPGDAIRVEVVHLSAAQRQRLDVGNASFFRAPKR